MTMRFFLFWLMALFLSVLPISGDEDEIEGGTVGTGIMGVITGLGSINVNGWRIEIPDGLMINSSLGQRSVNQLLIGETVVVEANVKPTGIRAISIRNYYPLVGPVGRLSADTISVIGVDVDISEIQRHDLEVGDWVAVSGLWRRDTVVASHVRRINSQSQVHLGAVFKVAADGSQMIGAIDLDATTLKHANSGDYLEASGKWDSATATFTPQQIQPELFSQQLDTLHIEGYLSNPDPNGAYTIYGSGFVAYLTDPQMVIPKERSVFCVNTDEAIQFHQSRELPGPPEERQKMLEDIALYTSGTLNCNAPAPRN